MSRGTLWRPRVSATYAADPSLVTDVPAVGTTRAASRCPNSSSGTPYTTTSATRDDRRAGPRPLGGTRSHRPRPPCRLPARRRTAAPGRRRSRCRRCSSGRGRSVCRHRPMYPPKASRLPTYTSPTPPSGNREPSSSSTATATPWAGRPTVPGAARRSAGVASVAHPVSVVPYRSNSRSPNSSMTSLAPALGAELRRPRRSRAGSRSRSRPAICRGQPHDPVQQHRNADQNLGPVIRDEAQRVLGPAPAVQDRRAAEREGCGEKAQSESVEQRRLDHHGLTGPQPQAASRLVTGRPMRRCSDLTGRTLRRPRGPRRHAPRCDHGRAGAVPAGNPLRPAGRRSAPERPVRPTT